MNLYISLTSIYDNQDILIETIKSILNQTMKSDYIYLYLSENPFLLDKGFKNKEVTNKNLLNLINNNNNIIIKWVDNIGSYRKLIYLLKEKWNENCLIITIDDDTVYNPNLIENLVNDYNKYKCVIGYRGFTPKCNNLKEFNYKERIKLQNLSLYNFPTGKGGILYKPEFFHKTNNMIFEKNIYLNNLKTVDDIWFYLLRIKNNIKCYLDNKPFQLKDNSKKGLWCNFNSKNNNNTILLQNILKLLKI